MRRTTTLFILLAVALPLSWWLASTAIGHVRYHLNASTCAASPTPACFGVLAALRLPGYGTISTGSEMWLDFLLLGQRETVASRQKSDDTDVLNRRESVRLYELLQSDIAAFSAEPLHDRPEVYGVIAGWLNPDYLLGASTHPRVSAAVVAAMRRREAPEPAPEREALMRRWRESLDEYADWRSHWVRYGRESLALGQLDEVRSALENNSRIAAGDHERWPAIELTWRAFGTEQAEQAILGLDGAFERRNFLLILAGHAQREGDVDDARMLLSAFEAAHEGFDFGETVAAERRSVNLARQQARYRAWPSVAGRLAHELGADNAALRWAETFYAALNQHPHAAPDRFIEAADLFASVGAGDRAAEVAREALARVRPEVEMGDEPNWQWRRVPQQIADIARVFASAGAGTEAVATAREALRRAPRRGLQLHTLFGSWQTSDWHDSVSATVAAAYCELQQFDEAVALIGDNPVVAYEASRHCVPVFRAANARLSITELARTFNLQSSRWLETEHAAALVEAGDYASAAEFIRGVLNSPPSIPGSAAAWSNLDYLRLAAAMRDAKLVKDVATQVIADNATGKRMTTVRALQEAGMVLFDWPGYRPAN